MRHLSLLGVAAAMLLAACADQTPAGPTPAADPPSFGISDGNNSGGNDDFFFLPPLVPEPAASNTDYKDRAFNPNLRPTVVICELAGSSCSSVIVKTFSASDVTVSLTDQHYSVNWHTDESALKLDKLYRIRVMIGSTQLGFADVDPVTSKELKNYQTGQNIPLLDGRTLPIKFRIEFGALVQNTNDFFEGTYTRDGTSNTQTLVTNTRLGGVQLPGNLEITGGGNTATVTIERILPGQTGFPDRCHAGLTLPESGGCFAFNADPQLRMPTEAAALATPEGRVRVVFGVCRDGTTNVELLKTGPNGQRMILPGAAAPFVEAFCTTGGISSLGDRSNRFLSLASAKVRSLAGGLAQLVTPRTAFAEDAGSGGHVTCPTSCDMPLFSNVGWVRPLKLTVAGGNGQSAVTGMALTTPLSVLVERVHRHGNDPNPLPHQGARIVFQTTGGSFATCTPAAPCPTGSDGKASAVWTLGTLVGTQTATASVVDANGNVINDTNGNPLTVSFTATAAAPFNPVIFKATFTNDALNALPGAPEVGTWSVVSQSAGTIRVQQSAGDLADKPVVLTQGTGTGGVNLGGSVAGTAPTSGTYVATWRSLVASPNVEFAGVALRGAGLIVAALEYRPNGALTYGTSSTTQPVSVGTWTQGVAQTFTITVNLDAKTTSLSIDGSPVTAAQNVPFYQSTASSLDRIAFEAGGTTPQTFAWDDVYIIAAGCPPNVPQPQLALESATTEGSNTHVELDVPNFASFPNVLFAPGPDLPPCGLNTSSSRSWVNIYNGTTDAYIYGFCALGTAADLNSIWFSVPTTQKPSEVYITIEDRRCGVTYTSNKINIP